MYNETTIKTRLNRINKKIKIKNKCPALAIITKKENKWHIGITQYLGTIGKSTYKEIICDNYMDFIKDNMHVIIFDDI